MVNIDSVNGLLSCSTRPLAEPMIAYDQLELLKTNYHQIEFEIYFQRNTFGLSSNKSQNIFLASMCEYLNLGVHHFPHCHIL